MQLLAAMINGQLVHRLYLIQILFLNTVRRSYHSVDISDMLCDNYCSSRPTYWLLPELSGSFHGISPLSKSFSRG